MSRLGDYAIQTDSLSRNFGSVRAVRELTLKVPRGVVFGFLGPNGSGKTTTIRLLLGLLEPSAGRAEVLGFDTRTQADEIRRQSGSLLEHHGLYERLSAWENLEFYGRVAGLSRGVRAERIEGLLTHLGLWERRNDIAGSWSRGMKQKLAVARALLHRPPLIFLDEPTAGLDPVASAALREDLAQLAAESGVTVFLTTHNLNEAESLCALVGVIRRGKLLAIGSPAQLHAQQETRHISIRGRGFDESSLLPIQRISGVKELQLNPLRDGSMIEQEITLRLDRTSSVAPIVSVLVHLGGSVEEVRRSGDSLEQIFLSLMESGDDDGQVTESV